MAMPSWSWLAVIWLVGGVAGAACDQIHVQFGVLAYPLPQLWGQPWWVMPNFGVGAVLIALLSQPLVRMAVARRPRGAPTLRVVRHDALRGGDPEGTLARSPHGHGRGRMG